MKVLSILFLLTFTKASIASIDLCNTGIQSKVCKLVETLDDYIAETPPTPFPALVSTVINIIDVIHVDEDEQTVTMQIRVTLSWNEYRLSVNRTQADIENNVNWYLISLGDLEQIWSPSIYIGNSLTVEGIGSIGDNYGNLHSVWFQPSSQTVYFSEKLITTFSCTMTHQDYPFDTNECRMMLINWLGSTLRVKLITPVLFLFDYNLKTEVSGTKVKKESKKLGFDFEFEALPPAVFLENAYEYSMVEINVKLKRTSKARSRIFSSYHTTTGTFALLSLVSFFIEPEQVPGRMGLLITLCLIMINSYNSVDAPTNRGFSSVEIWFVGTLIPILFGLLEFGLVLALQKFGDPIYKCIQRWGFQAKPLLKWIDFVSFLLTMAYIVCFNVFFWF